MKETPQAFAARYWGGKDVVPVKSGATYGPRACDGGQPRYPAGYAFEADGFRYRVYHEAGPWTMVASDGSFATFHREGTAWVVNRGYTNEQLRVPAFDEVPA